MEPVESGVPAMKYPEISVIVPVYQVERWVERCVRSIQQQSFSDFELILVDDGSTDRSGSLCDCLARTDARIRVIHQPNQGLSAARNVGIEQSRGKYLCFADSDDYLSPEMLTRLYDALLAQDAQIALCNFVYEGEHGEACNTELDYQFTEEETLSGREVLLRARQDRYAVYEIANAKLYRREVFETLRFPLGRLHEDEFVFHRIFLPCSRVVCLPYTGYHYMQRAGSITTQHSPQQERARAEAYLDRCLYLEAHGEKELAMREEGKLLSLSKREISGKRELRREQWKLAVRLYRRGWMDALTLCKRWVRCRLLPVCRKEETI